MNEGFFLGVDGLKLVENFVSNEEETLLLDQINQQTWNTSLSRRTQHYGYEYNYTDKDAKKEAPEIPAFCTFLVDRLLEREILKERPDQLIINEYKPGQGIAPHVDHIKQFKDGIVSISLGSSVRMDFESTSDPKEKKSGILPRRSLLSMHGVARYKYRHGIQKRLTDPGIPGKRGVRVSLTFRKIK